MLKLESEDGFTFLGLISMVDPPRVESQLAFADAKRAGILSKEFMTKLLLQGGLIAVCTLIAFHKSSRIHSRNPVSESGTVCSVFTEPF